jgi:hypothetical protein
VLERLRSGSGAPYVADRVGALGRSRGRAVFGGEILGEILV